MSDGPHRSLKKRAAWKKVAEFADKRVFTHEEIGHAVAAALADDWRIDVAPNIAECVCDVLGGQRDSLFRDQTVAQLEALLPLTAGRELAQVFIDCAIRRAASSEPSANAAVEAAADALEIWGARHGRHIEEHYRRESTERRAFNVRSRIEQGIGGTPRVPLVRQLLKLEPRTAPRTLPKQTGLDDGVRL
jgi:hypothetical protein